MYESLLNVSKITIFLIYIFYILVIAYRSLITIHEPCTMLPHEVLCITN